MNKTVKISLLVAGIFMFLFSFWIAELVIEKPIVTVIAGNNSCGEGQTCYLKICNKPNSNNISTYCVNFPYMNVTDCSELEYICTYDEKDIYRWDDVLGMNCSWETKPELVCSCIMNEEFVKV